MRVTVHGISVRNLRMALVEPFLRAQICFRTLVLLSNPIFKLTVAHGAFTLAPMIPALYLGALEAEAEGPICPA